MSRPQDTRPMSAQTENGVSVPSYNGANVVPENGASAKSENEAAAMCNDGADAPCENGRVMPARPVPPEAPAQDEAKDTPASGVKPPVLEINRISMRFGGLMALTEVEMHAAQGEVTAIIGPNGAGKTTLFNCITCIYKPTAGEVVLNAPLRPGDTDVTRHRLGKVKPFEATALGMARTFQNIRLFPAMSVLENVMVGRHCRTKAGILGALFRPRYVRREEEAIVERSYQLLKYMGLHKYYREEARNLAYGQQRRLEIARALATDPYLLLLDEPAAGMNPQETLELRDIILKIRDEFKLSVLLIEHDMNMVMNISDKIFVMEYGCLIAQGAPEQISHDPRVIKAYLGEEFNA